MPLNHLQIYIHPHPKQTAAAEAEHYQKRGGSKADLEMEIQQKAFRNIRGQGFHKDDEGSKFPRFHC